MAAANRRRIVVALDTGEPDRAQLERLSRLASNLDAELEAVFVEDTDLLDLADLPFTREYRFASRRLESISLDRLEQELNAAAKRAEQMLSRETALRRVPWHFRVWRGSLERELLAALQADVLEIGRTARRAAPIRGLAGTTVWFEDTPAGHRALATAAMLTAGNGGELTVAGTGPPTALEAAARRVLAELAQAPAAPAVIAVEIVGVRTAEILSEQLRAGGGGVLVAPRDSALLRAAPLRLLLSRLPRSLILTA
jgi:hypothetical protein